MNIHGVAGWLGISAVAVLVNAAGCSMSNCIAEGTAVATPSGLRPIESLRAGDEVLSISQCGEQCVSTVVNTRATRVNRIHELKFGDGRLLELTAEHPVRVDERWVTAGDIESLQRIMTDAGAAQVASNCELQRATRVVDLTVSPHENFFANGVLVHNKSFPRPPSPEDLAGLWIMRGFHGVWYRFDLNPDGTGTAGFTTWKVVWNEGVKYEFRPMELVAWSLAGTKIQIQLRQWNGELLLLEGHASLDGIRNFGTFSFHQGLIVERPETLHTKLEVLGDLDSAQTQPSGD
jgi:hypothetical protein